MSIGAVLMHDWFSLLRSHYFGPFRGVGAMKLAPTIDSSVCHSGRGVRLASQGEQEWITAELSSIMAHYYLW